MLELHTTGSIGGVLGALALLVLRLCAARPAAVLDTGVMSMSTIRLHVPSIDAAAVATGVVSRHTLGD